METKLSSSSLQRLKTNLGFTNCFMVDSMGMSGGLALLWHDEMDIHLLSFSKNHIDVKISKWLETDYSFFTGVYDCPEASQRQLVSELLKRLGFIE